MLLPLQDNNPTLRAPFVVYGLIAINVAVMLWQSQFTPLDERIAVVKHGFIPQRIAQLSDIDRKFSRVHRIRGTAHAKTRLIRRNLPRCPRSCRPAAQLPAALQDWESTAFSSSARRGRRRRQNQSLRQLDTSVSQVV